MPKGRDLTDCLLPFWHKPESQQDEPVSENNGPDAEADKLFNILNDSPFKRHCANNAEVWKTYLTLARRFDDHLVTSLNNSVDPLLIFAGLFSAILTAFLIEIRTDKTTDSLLFSIVLGQHTIADDVPFQPDTAFRWINALWFASLVASLGSALGASLAKGWASPFSVTSPGSGWSNAVIHSKRWCGAQRWHLKPVIQFLPFLIHTAVILFGVGLVLLLFQDDRDLGIVILYPMAILGVLYLMPTFLRAIFRDSPFRTPISEIIPLLCRPRGPRATPFPSSSEDAQKAFALAWLLKHSLEDDTTDAAIRAVAGLPFIIEVQDELVRGDTAGTISNRLSAELLKETMDPAFLRGCLFALLHLVQTKPLDVVDAMVSTTTGPLRNVESMPTGVHEVALCVKGRILLLSKKPPEKESLEGILFETDIPVLVKCCQDPCLLRSLREVCVLRDWQTFLPNDFASLKSTDVSERYAAHAKLTTEANKDGVTFNPKLQATFFSGGLNSRFARSQVASFLAIAARYEAISDMIETSKIYQRIFSLMTNEYFDELVEPFLQLARNSKLRRSLSTAETWRVVLQYCSRDSTETIDIMRGVHDLVGFNDVGQGFTERGIEGQLIQFLGHESPRVRHRTVKLFFRTSPKHLSSALLSGLVNRLNDESSEIRAAAVDLLKKSTKDSFDTETTSKVWESIYAIRLTLNTLVFLSESTLPDGAIFEAASPDLESIPGLLQAVWGDETEREAAVRGTRFLAEHSTVTIPMVTYLLVLGGDSYWVSSAVFAAIQAIASRDGFESAILSEEAQEKLVTLLKDPAWFVRRDTLRMLVGLAKPDALVPRFIHTRGFEGNSHRILLGVEEQRRSDFPNR
ncbi:hypothetical protein R3P38DRAFT_328575 [Favolaschia claudopus]|uniref:DUF6535 domain-containing protein n=1 Tax=Favolaschia claudopus TaxID=2862362 RepID=A0AAV9ZNB8_9AGAR